MKTSSEIDTVSKRATKASGFSWGIAEEVGQNTKTLELFGIWGIENLNAYLKSLKNQTPEGPKKILQENQLQGKAFCPFYTGTALIDAAHQVVELRTLQFKSLNFPILLLPFINRLSYKIGRTIIVKMDDYEILLNLNKFITSNKDIRNIILPSAEIFKINILESKDTFKPDTWNQLYELSTETFVEETERLKSTGAGAGLVDND
tara:strand:- start:324 stop:938 length:615 start_codon:yes stop_codon:yes gene_type:complete